MNVLYVTPYVPSRIRTRPYHLIRALARLGHSITLLAAAGTAAEDETQADELRGWGVKVQVFPVTLVRSLGNCLRALPTREPLQAAFAYHPGMARRLSALSQEETFDVVHVEHLRAARLVRAVRGMPTVYDAVDCISLLFEQTMQHGAQLRSRLMATVDLARTRRYEARLLTQYDQVVVTSQRDKHALEALAHRYLPPEAQTAPVTVVTNGVDLEYFNPSNLQPPTSNLQPPTSNLQPPTSNLQPPASNLQPPTVIFTGKMSYHANVAAVLYFAREVLPHIWAQAPDVRFQIVGKDPPEAVQQLTTDERIQVTGTVDDLRPYLAQAAVAVCPALYAVGVQNKVLEAMAMGTPVVSTPAGCAALATTEGQEILTAEGHEALAAAVLQVFSDPALAERLAVAGRRYVETYHSWESGARRLLEVYQEAWSGASSRKTPYER